MTVYEAYNRFPITLYDWDLFVQELPKFILPDKTLTLFFEEYSYFTFGIVIELTFEDRLTNELNEGLYDIAYSKHKVKYNKQELYNKIVSTAHEQIKNILLEGIEGIMRDPVINLKPDYLKKELSGSEHARLRTHSLKFEKSTLLRKIENWNSLLISDLGSTGIKKIPIIKKVEFFDPTIYKILLKTPALLKTMDWRLFEEMLADILKKFKYEVELTRPTKDGGIDIIAIKKNDNFGEHKYLLQAKKYNKSVQVSPVRELLFLHDEYKATKSCLATTASFTKGAWQLADQHKWKLELKDHQGILDWISIIVNKNL